MSCDQIRDYLMSCVSLQLPQSSYYINKILNWIVMKGGFPMEVNRVLWPTDFSSSAEKALPYVTDLTQKYGAEIHVLYVIENIAHHDGW